MKMTPLAVVTGSLLILATIVFVVVLLPYVHTNQTTPSDIFRQRSDAEAAGRKLYIANGCVYCHSQSIRTIDWGLGAERIAQAGDYVADYPILLGSQRTGNLPVRPPDHHRHRSLPGRPCIVYLSLFHYPLSGGGLLRRRIQPGENPGIQRPCAGRAGRRRRSQNNG